MKIKILFLVFTFNALYAFANQAEKAASIDYLMHRGLDKQQPVLMADLKKHDIKNETDIPLRIRIREGKQGGFIYFDEVVPPNSIITIDLYQIANDKGGPAPKGHLRFTPTNPDTNQEIVSGKGSLKVTENRVKFEKKQGRIRLLGRPKTVDDLTE